MFEKFNKIPRYSRDIVITEKIDGTNAQIFIERYVDSELVPSDMPHIIVSDQGFEYVLAAGSRKRWIHPGDDNFGFATWAWEYAQELVQLGEGRHFGEWWGAGIQRKYGQDEKHFSLFNTDRWSEDRPACCDLVPTLYRGPHTEDAIESALDELAAEGSRAAPGFMDPEGIVVYHTAANTMFKKTLKDDGLPKGFAA